MKTIIFNHQAMVISAPEERALKVLKNCNFSAKKSDFAEGSGNYIHTVLPKDRSRRKELGIYEVYQNDPMGNVYSRPKGGKEQRFFNAHPRCRSGIFANPRRINAILLSLNSSHVTYPDGSKYVGELKDGKQHGRGTYNSAYGKYVGEYKDGKSHGQGTFTDPDGNKYAGEFRDGEANGQGTMTYPNGPKYVGEFRDNKYHGQGTLTFPDGTEYVGEFRDDKYHGLS